MADADPRITDHEARIAELERRNVFVTNQLTTVSSNLETTQRQVGGAAQQADLDALRKASATATDLTELRSDLAVLSAKIEAAAKTQASGAPAPATAPASGS